MDLEIREFSATIEKYMNDSGLPWEVKKMCMKELYEKAAFSANESVRKQIEERSVKESE